MNCNIEHWSGDDVSGGYQYISGNSTKAGQKSGVILFRYGKEDVFQKFIEDVLPNITLLSLPEGMYKEIIEFRKAMNLDFDDAYQYGVAKYFGLKIVTMDRDFEKVKDVEVEFLQDVVFN